jgi:hypothetical protein
MPHQSNSKLALSTEEEKCINSVNSPWLKKTSEKLDKDLYASNNSIGPKIPNFKRHDQVPVKGNSVSFRFAT